MVIDALRDVDRDELIKSIEIIESTVQNNKIIYVMGNGGSASTASHMKSDLSNTLGCLKGMRVNVSCLSDSIATITVIANDYSYDLIYKKQLEGRINQGDLVIAVSGSGNSQNIIKAAEYAKSVRANIVAMTGYDGGKLKDLADFNLHVPIDNMQISEDVHLLFNHLITYILSCSNKGTSYDCS
jgi:D-sedoheptulose 7-phosphate isomerase